MGFSAFLPLLASIVGGGLAGFGGKDARQGSSYGKGQLSSIDDILAAIKGMRGEAQDITQNPQFQQGQDALMSLFNDPDFFKNIEAPAFRQFNEEIIPGLAHRFGGMGSGGNLNSTAFRNQFAREGSNLATNLSANRTAMQQQAIPQLLNYAQQPFSNLATLQQQALQPTQNVNYPATQGFFGPIASAFAGGASQGYGQQWGQNMANQNMRFPGQHPTVG